jgi:hypothetical protein
MELLRRFSDLMEATTVETNAKIECAICFESLALTSFLRLVRNSRFAID